LTIHKNLGHRTPLRICEVLPVLVLVQVAARWKPVKTKEESHRWQRRTIKLISELTDNRIK
jgi:hypothetical protein